MGDGPVQKINVVGLKPLQAFRNRAADVVWVIIDLATALGRDFVSKFRGQKDLCSYQRLSRISQWVVFWYIFPLACTPKPLAQQLLAVSVELGRVPVHATELVNTVE